jgi:peptidoglycan/LPS O-acetylase OafA/YrhL
MPKVRLIPALDGVRGIAALMVMFFHHFQDHPLTPAAGDSPPGRLWWGLQQLTVFGLTGVDLFFVLSGFLITRILIATRHRDGYWSSFYSRRALRIVPLYYFGLVLYYCTLYPPSETGLSALREQWWYWTYLQNVPDTFPGLSASGPMHFWSLAVEEQFYLIWPFVILITPPRRLATICYATIGAAVIARCVLIHYGLIAFYLSPCRMDALACGALLAAWERDGRLTHYRSRLMIGGIILAIVLAATRLMIGGRHLFIDRAMFFTVLAAFYVCGVGIVAVGDSQRPRILSAGLLRYTGLISYGLYVYHPLVFHYVDAWQGTEVCPAAANLAIKVAATYAVASVSYFGFERWFLMFKDRLNQPIVVPPKIAA